MRIILSDFKFNVISENFFEKINAAKQATYKIKNKLQKKKQQKNKKTFDQKTALPLYD